MRSTMCRRILPAVYNFVGMTWNATPSQLGALTLCRALVQALSSPIGGFLGGIPLCYPCDDNPDPHQHQTQADACLSKGCVLHMEQATFTAGSG
jgi:hypothetical protein